jgi:hypothetical protein
VLKEGKRGDGKTGDSGARVSTTGRSSGDVPFSFSPEAIHNLNSSSPKTQEKQPLKIVGH